jgi:hypothetical protein
MALPTTPEGIYDLIEADPILPGLLGEFVRPSPQEPLPMLSVMHQGERLPERWEPQGLEVRIAREVSYPDARAMHSGEVHLRPIFRLYVTQWTKGEADYVLQTATERLLALLPGATAEDVSLPPELAGGLGQVAVKWQNPEPYLPHDALTNIPEPEPEGGEGDG